MAHNVKCTICGETFDRDKIPFIQTGARRYTHKECPDPTKVKPKTEEQLILEYCEHIFGKDKTNYAAIKKQIKQFVKEYGYTESGIRKTLIWWYEVKGQPPEKANGSIGM